MQHCASRAGLFLVSLSLACSAPALSNRPPQLAVEPTTLDFGTVDSPTPATKQITVTNVGFGPLLFHGVTIAADPNHVFSTGGAPAQLGVGASGSIAVVMTPPGEPGHYAGSLVIASNAASNPQALVQLSVNVIPAPADAGMDAGIPAVDAGVDAGSEDAGMDAGSEDAGMDAGSEDAGVDAGVDAGADAGSEDGGCPSGELLCSNKCTDPLSDPENCGSCQNRCGMANTGCVNGTCVPCAPTSGYAILAQDQGQPYSISVDSANVYWTAQTAPAVMELPLTGGTPITLVNAAQANAPGFFLPNTLATFGGNVFFANQTARSVMEVDSAGNNLITLTPPAGTDAWPSKLAVSSDGVYWVTTTTGAVWRGIPGHAGMATILVAAPNPPVSGEQYEMLGVDSTSVYWLAEGSPASGYTDGAIMKVGLTGGAASTVISGLTWPRDGAVDSASVYWTSSVEGLVMKVSSAGGGTPVTLASGLDGPRNLVVDSANAYWSVGGTDSSLMSCSGAIQKVSLNGGPVTDVVFGQYSAWAAAVDQSSLYWTDLYYGTLMRTRK